MNTNRIQSSTNFGKLYMPSTKVLLESGKEFAEKAESQRSALAKLAQDVDIYAYPQTSSTKGMYHSIFSVVKPTITTLMNTKLPKQSDYFIVETVSKKGTLRAFSSVENLCKTVCGMLKQLT